MYRLSTVSANQLNLAKGRIVSERTPNPIAASGIVMTSSDLLPYSNPEAAKQAIQTTALTPNEPSRASDQPCVTTLFTTKPSSPLAAAKINKPQKKWSRLRSRNKPFEIGTSSSQPGLADLLIAVARFKVAR
jgi:hypothetical protein